MKKSKILLPITTCLLTLFFTIIPVLKINAQTDTVGSADSYNGSAAAPTDNSWVSQGDAASNNQQSSLPSSIMLGGGDSSYNTFNSNSSAADNAAYQAKIKSLYTGYASSTSSQSSVGQSIGACIGSFVGNAMGSRLGSSLGDMFGSSGTTQQVPTDDKKTNYREETLNGVAFCAGNALINLMSDQIVAWINNGFKNPDGTKGPSFLSNPGSFFKQVADREAGAFFQSLGPIGNVVCKPFDLQIRLALLNDYKGGSGQQQCSLTSIKQNFANFGKGSNGFSGDFFQLTQQDQNNAMGSYFIARDKMAEGIKYTVAENKLEVDLGKGFLNFKKCVKYSTTTKDPNTGKAQCSEWQTTTPGSEVQASLDRAMGSKTHRLEIATNFNQIVSALVGQIVQMAVKGLSGQADSGSGGHNNTADNYGYPYVENTLTISSIYPISGKAGTIVTITGTGFTPTGNTIRFGNLGTENNPLYSLLNSPDGKNITFTVPLGNYLACFANAVPCAGAHSTYPGTYDISVINTNGVSSSNIFFTVVE